MALKNRGREMALARFLRGLTRFRRIQPQVGRAHAALLRRSGGRIRRSRLLGRSSDRFPARAKAERGCAIVCDRLVGANLTEVAR